MLPRDGDGDVPVGSGHDAVLEPGPGQDLLWQRQHRNGLQEGTEQVGITLHGHQKRALHGGRSSGGSPGWARPLDGGVASVPCAARSNPTVFRYQGVIRAWVIWS